MAAKIAGANAPKFGVDALLPPLIAFGPLFLLMDLHNSIQAALQRAD